MLELNIPDEVEKGKFYLVWTSTPDWPRSSSSSSTRPRIAILDSSYNPPTIAHAQIAAAPLPRTDTALRIAGLPLKRGGASEKVEQEQEEYTARLLLFSTTNVDKTPKPHDPTIRQRVDMIQKLAIHLHSQAPHMPVAIGLMCEATFVGKSSIIHSHFAEQHAAQKPHLSFLIGTDTLTRFFETRYYPPGQMQTLLDNFFDQEGSTVVSARRGRGHAVDEAEQEVLRREELRRWLLEGQIRLLDQPGEGGAEWGDVSSTAIRDAVRAGDEERVRSLVVDGLAEYIAQAKLYRE